MELRKYENRRKARDGHFLPRPRAWLGLLGLLRGLGCRVQGLGFRVQGLGFRVQGVPSLTRGCVIPARPTRGSLCIQFNLFIIFLPLVSDEQAQSI